MCARGAERSGVLVVRAWIEADEILLRARITGRLDALRTEETVETAAGVDHAAAVVRRWLEAFERGDDSVTGA
jgi:hypothetical protein